MRFGTRMNPGDSLKRPLLSRWPAAFIAAVLIGTTALVLLVEPSVTTLMQVLPLEVLPKDCDVAFMNRHLFALQLAPPKPPPRLIPQPPQPTYNRSALSTQPA